VPPVRPSLVTTADVEAVLVAPAQVEGDVGSAAGRAGMLVSQVVWPELWMPVPRVARVES
jgi:hypothetical protein